MDLWILTGFFLGLIVYILYLLSKSYFYVQEGCLAVVTIFGKALELERNVHPQRRLRTFSPGFHRKLPWQKVKMVSLMEQMIELSGEEGGTLAMASDGTMLRLDSKLRFTPVKEDLYNFLFSIEKPIEHVKGLFICLLRNEIANFDQNDTLELAGRQSDRLSQHTSVGSYAAIRRERTLLNHRIRDFCRLWIGDRYGIRFDGVDLTDILPPDELAHALNGVINAQSEAQKLYAQKEGESEQRFLAAKKGLSIAKMKAKAVEEEIQTMAKILVELEENKTLDLYLERRRAEVYSDARTSFMMRPTL
ncbi:MAG: hypothetical protein KA436_02475 [Oligoflexales bacterium]|nr:hypothetical protein [Oligoflexales bacterium]